MLKTEDLISIRESMFYVYVKSRVFNLYYVFVLFLC